MRAMILKEVGPIEGSPLVLRDLPVPEPGQGEVRLRVRACGICRTDLHVVEGDLPPVKEHIVPGHQVVGVVDALGPGAKRLRLGDRVGAAWLRQTCGVCPYCRQNKENLCENASYTGYTHPGGFAEYMIAREAFVYPLPPLLGDEETTPLLCAGIIGFRALRRSQIRPGQRLGLYGFGASAHITIQVALYWGCEVFVCTRNEKHRDLARKMGATWVGGALEPPPVRLQGAIVFAPAGEIVPAALRAVDRGGTVALAGVTMTAVPAMDYDECLFHERTLQSVMANTRDDGRDLLTLAARIPIRPRTITFPLEMANEALRQLKHDGFQGAGVLTVGRD